MATAPLPSAENSLTCSICMEEFNNPQILPCLHSFCEQCLHNHVRTRQVNGHFRCPLCNADTVVPSDGFKSNFHLTAIIEELKQRKPLVEQKETHAQSNCLQHRDECLNLFCEDCETPVCAVCVTGVHVKHTVIALHKALVRTVSVMQTEMASVRQKLKTVQKRVGGYKEAQALWDDEIDRLGKVVRDRFANIRLMTNEKEQQVLCAMKQKGATIKARLKGGERGTSQRERVMIASLHNAQRIVDCENPIEVLNQFKGTMKHLGDANKLVVPDMSTNPIFSVDLSIPEVYLKFESGRMVNKVSPMLPKTKLVASFSTRLRGEGGSQCFGIHYSNETFLLADLGNSKVKIYDTNGKFKGLLNQGRYQLKYPNDITINSDGDIFVTDNNIKGVVVYDKNLNQIRVATVLCKGDGCGITCNYNRLIVAHHNTLTVLDMNCVVQCVVDASQLGLGRFTPRYVTTSPTGNIIVSDKNNKCVYILDITCTCILHTYRPEGELALKSPRGVACDKRGHIFIADYAGNCLHEISARGKHLGVIVTGEDGLAFPAGVTISGRGQVSVVEWYSGDVKVYQYMD